MHCIHCLFFSFSSPTMTPFTIFTFLLALLSFMPPCLSSLYQPPAPTLTYHNGALLEGAVPVSVLYYGAFSPHQKAIIADFLLSLTPQGRRAHAFAAPPMSPSVAQWWATVDRYVQKAGKERTQVLLTNQIAHEGYSLGKVLSRVQVEQLAARLGVAPGGIAVVLTAADVAVDGFCVSACGLHGSSAGGAAHVWVGNAAVQCPGRCTWPFHAADNYMGPRSGEVLHPPNGDAGVDGMIINLATLLAGTVTNPYGNGYFQGDAGAPVEVAAACPGMYGHGAYPGYPGAVKLDTATGGSYNAIGKNGRKYLVPALVDPVNYSCLIMG